MTTNGNGVCTFDAERHAYAIDGVPALSVTQVIASAGLEEDYSGVPLHYREAAKLRGTYVHEACDLLDQRRLDEAALDPALAPYVGAYRACRHGEPFTVAPNDESSFEHRVWWKPFGLAGTLDRMGVWSGTRTVLELKTSKKLAWTYGIQLALYTALLLLQEGVALGKPMRAAFEKITRRVIQLKDDGTYHIAHYDDPEDLTTAIAALHVARAKQQHGGGGR
jgi:hypothetical protein